MIAKMFIKIHNCKLVFFGLLLFLTMANVGKAKSADVEDRHIEEFGVVEMRGDVLLIKNTLLTKSIVDKALSISAGAKSMEIINVPGGIYSHVNRLAERVRDMHVTAQGFCMSGCAFVALSAKSLSLKANPVKPATMLVIHGLFDVRDGRWSSLSFHDLNFYHERLKIVPRDVIEKSLGYKSPTASGLFILREKNSTPILGDALVYTCEKAPENCNPIPSIELSSMGILID